MEENKTNMETLLGRPYSFNTVIQNDEECDIFNIMESNGFGFVRCTVYNGDNMAFISDLFVGEAFRKQRIGLSLIHHAELYALRSNVEFVELKVVKDSWQQDWYERLGYKKLSCDEKYNWMIKYIGNEQ